MTVTLPAWLNEIIVSERIRVSGSNFLEDSLLHKKASSDFEGEWQEHQANEMSRTWGFEASQRLEQLYLETNTSTGQLPYLTVLDAGCGNGLLTEAIARGGSKVMGVDLINNLGTIIKNRQKSDNLFFLKADLQNLPLKENSFDLIISNGVLHHTPDTKASFLRLARFVKPGGKLYVWLYRKPFQLHKRLTLAAFDTFRVVISRLPKKVQKPILYSFAKGFYLISRFKRKERDFKDLLLDVYDSFTPRYRHYHQPIEVAGWFYEAGFSAPVLSHWDNSFGFGMVAYKNEGGPVTPGENFGRPNRDPLRHLG